MYLPSIEWRPMLLRVRFACSEHVNASERTPAELTTPETSFGASLLIAAT